MTKNQACLVMLLMVIGVLWFPNIVYFVLSIYGGVTLGIKTSDPWEPRKGKDVRPD